MKMYFLIFFFVQIVRANIAMATPKTDEALFYVLAKAFPASLQFPGHFTQEISVANLKCASVSDKYDCRAEDGDSKEMIAKESDALMKALKAFKPSKISNKKNHRSSISFSVVTCTQQSERSDKGGQQQSYECTFEQ